MNQLTKWSIRNGARYYITMILKIILLSIKEFYFIWIPTYILELLICKEKFENILISIVILYLVYFLVDSLHEVLSNILEYNMEKVENAYRVGKIEKIFGLPYELIETQSFHDDLYSAQTTDRIYGAFHLYLKSFEQYVQSILNIIAAIFYFGLLMLDIFRSEDLTLFVSLAGLLLLAAGFSVLAFYQRKKEEKRNETLMNSVLSENMRLAYLCNNIIHEYRYGKHIRMYGMQNKIMDDLRKQQTAIEDTIHKINRSAIGPAIFQGVFPIIIYVSVFLLMGKIYYEGFLSASTVLWYAGILKLLMESIGRVLQCRNEIKLQLAKEQNGARILNWPDEKNKLTETNNIDRLKINSIELKDVCYSYPNTDVEILHKISLKLQFPNEYAFVGPNGSGKSTLIKLLSGYLKPTSGQILINNEEIENIPTNILRDSVAAVFQDYFISAYTVAENVSFSNEIHMERLERVLKESGSGSVNPVDSVTQELDPQGIELSGGESQKLAIARALYKDSEFIILDEPTSALSPLAEREIYELFNNATQNKSVIYISHRLSSCRFANKIFVLDKGNIVQEGKHQKLINEDGLYYQLWNAQAKYYQ